MVPMGTNRNRTSSEEGAGLNKIKREHHLPPHTPDLIILKIVVGRAGLEGVADFCRQVGFLTLNPGVRLNTQEQSFLENLGLLSRRQGDEQSQACCGPHGFSQ